MFDTFEEIEEPAVGNWRPPSGIEASGQVSGATSNINKHPKLIRSESELARKMAEQLSDKDNKPMCSYSKSISNVQPEQRARIIPAPDLAIVSDDEEEDDVSCIPNMSSQPTTNTASNIAVKPESPPKRLQYVPRASSSKQSYGSIPIVSGSSARLPSANLPQSTKASTNGDTKKRKAQYVDLTVSSDSNASDSGHDSDLQITGSIEPSIQVDNSPQFLGQINAVILILNPVDELSLEASENQLTPPPLYVTFVRPPPTALGGGRMKESVYVISSESGEKFGALEGRVADVLGPVVGGKPFQDGRVQIRGYAMRQGKSATTVG